MTPRQLIYNFNLNTKIFIKEWNDKSANGRDFRRHCERIMRFPADMVAQALDESRKIWGDKPPFWHIKTVHDILIDLEKKQFQAPMTPTAKQALRSLLS